jgi:glycosyltransferase involved in cell wall biosynthesis
MRVAVVARTTERRGGIETYLEMILGGLAARGHALLLLCEDAAGPGEPLIDVPPAVTLIEQPDAPRGAVAGALRQWGPDVVFSQGLLSPDRERECLAVAPVIFLAHTYHGTCISGRKMFQLPVETPCHRRFGRACLFLYLPRRCGGLSPATMIAEYRRQSDRLDVVRGCAAVVTLSDYMREEYIAHGIDPARVVTLPQWLPDGSEADAATAGPPGAAQPLRIAFIGRLQREKGVHLALEALPMARARLARSIRLTIAGHGPFGGRLEAQAARLCDADAGIEVRFAGRVDAAERSRLLSDTDVLVFPSVWPEPFGLVGLEAAAAGVPVAAFRVGGVPEWLVDGATGCLAAADPPTAAGLADAIIRCAGLPATRACVAARARSRVQDASRHLAALEQVFATALAHAALPATRSAS